MWSTYRLTQSYPFKCRLKQIKINETNIRILTYRHPFLCFLTFSLCDCYFVWGCFSLKIHLFAAGPLGSRTASGCYKKLSPYSFFIRVHTVFKSLTHNGQGSIGLDNRYCGAYESTRIYSFLKQP